MQRVVHFEIPSDDPEKSVRFYEEVFGWKFSRWGPEEYWLATTGEGEPGINGAIIKKRAPDMPVVVTVDVADMDEAISNVQKHGGMIVVPKSSVPGVGYLCYFKDPDGVIQGMMQSDKNAK